MTERWFRLLLHLYPADFRDELGAAIVDAYCARARQASSRGGVVAVAGVWLRALLDALWNGPAERLRPAASWRRSGNWGRDLEMARRRLVRAPLFLAATVATLTVGLGAFAVVYTAVDKILLEPLPYRAPENLYFVWRDQTASSGLPRDPLSGPDVAELQRAGGAIESAAAIQIVGPTLSAGPDSVPMQATIMLTSPNLFDLLGVTPAIGRVFKAQEVGPDRPSVIVLSHALWNRLGADPALVGGTVWLSGAPYTVIGVMKPEFRFARHGLSGPPQEADAYLSFAFHVADRDPQNTGFAALVRARDGTSPEQAAAAVNAAGRAASARYAQKRTFTLYPVGLHADLVAGVEPVLVTLGLAGVFLVLVLAVNLGSLLLARAAQREREFAVSRAVGANGQAIVRATLFEGAFLGLAGGIAGALAGRWGASVLVALAPADLPRRDNIALDWQVGAVVVAVGVGLGLAAALLPALWSARVSLGSLLAATTVRGTGGTVRLRRAMIVAQVAISLVLLSAGGLVVRSFQHLVAADPGFRPDGVLTFTVAMGPRLFPKPGEALLFQDRVDAALRELPHVSHVSATTALPLSTFAQNGTVTFPGAPGNTGEPEHDAPLVDVIGTRSQYADVMGLRLVAGRSFEPARPGGVQEALIDTHLARDFFPSGTAVGATLQFNERTVTIVGVVTQARIHSLHEDGRPQVYVRGGGELMPYTPSFVVRSDQDLGALAIEIPRVVRQVDPRIPVSSVRTMEEIVTDAVRQQRISAVLIAGFAVGALLLVSMGLFGMTSGSVAQRQGELAVRLALGATPGSVLRLVLREGAVLVTVGMLIAVPGIYAAGRVLGSLLVGVSALDPATLIAVAAGLSLVTLAACYLPARRVLRIDPAPLLRQV